MITDGMGIIGDATLSSLSISQSKSGEPSLLWFKEHWEHCV